MSVLTDINDKNIYVVGAVGYHDVDRLLSRKRKR